MSECAFSLPVGYGLKLNYLKASLNSKIEEKSKCCYENSTELGIFEIK